jgi:hypothetical protein
MKKNNNAIRNYIEKYKTPLSNEFFNQVNTIYDNDLQQGLSKIRLKNYMKTGFMNKLKSSSKKK